jgi:hypothetical protein
MQPGGSGSNHTDGAAQDQARGSDFTPCSAPVMLAVRPEKRFQLMLGPGQLRHCRAGQESGPVTPGDLPEGPQRRCQRARRRLGPRHCAQESPAAALPRRGLRLRLVAEDGGRLMDPVIPHPYVGP